jgi:predicted site-specific integrase-resolvase
LRKTQGRDFVIVNEALAAQSDLEQSDLMQDFVAIITALCARLDGRRRASRKKTQLLAALQEH